MQLFPHQQKALDLTAGKNRVAYYLDMGLGKTFVGGEKANSYPERIVLVCQKSKIDDWISHFKEHYPLTVFDLTNKKQLEEFTGTIGKCVGVINYDLVFRRSYFAHISGFTLVLDESSIIQNETAKRSKFILKMQPENVILLSGTPTAGKYEKLWSQLRLLGWSISKDLSTVGSYGHPAVVTEDRKFLFQRHIAYLKPRHNMVNSFYLHSALLAPDGQRQIEEKVKGIAQKTLNLSEIKKIVVPLPTIEEQNQFEKFVNQIDKSKVAIQKALDEAQMLFDSLMQKYFG